MGKRIEDLKETAPCGMLIHYTITLGATGIIICGIWVTSTAHFAGAQDVLTAVFASVTQGIVVAGLSTYIHQIIKQAGKEE